jgi:hypothetical protein
VRRQPPDALLPWPQPVPEALASSLTATSGGDGGGDDSIGLPPPDVLAARRRLCAVWLTALPPVATPEGLWPCTDGAAAGGADASLNLPAWLASDDGAHRLFAGSVEVVTAQVRQLLLAGPPLLSASGGGAAAAAPAFDGSSLPLRSQRQLPQMLSLHMRAFLRWEGGAGSGGVSSQLSLIGGGGGGGSSVLSRSLAPLPAARQLAALSRRHAALLARMSSGSSAVAVDVASTLGALRRFATAVSSAVPLLYAALARTVPAATAATAAAYQ